MRDSMAGVMGIPPAKIRVTTEEGRRRVRAEDRPLSRIHRDAGRREEDRPPGVLDVGRNESFVSDNHARDAYSDVELALDDKASSWRCASAISAAWAPTSARSAPTSRPPT
jgi:hypothetical protein